jgi:hypothetical protein
MYRNDCIVRSPAATDNVFPLWKICGRWKSTGGSPDIRIYFTGKRYRLVFSYDRATVFLCPIYRYWGQPCFFLYGRIDLSYHTERDVLTLSEYGEYVRAEEEAAGNSPRCGTPC